MLKNRSAKSVRKLTSEQFKEHYSKRQGHNKIIKISQN
jgi:hypothetical protein